MNMLEHFSVVTEEFNSKYYGEVVDRDDPENLHRVRVRVFGIFDEPINKDHIPWAYPINLYPKLPAVGEKVVVEFIRGDIYYPVYYS